MICLSGSVKVTLETSTGKNDYVLSDRSKGLFIGPGAWRVMSEFADNTVIMVIADEVYKEADYIRDYGEFKREMCK